MRQTPLVFGASMRIQLLWAMAIAAAASVTQPEPTAAQIIGGLHVGGPVRASVAFGYAWTGERHRRSHGPMVLAEPGLGGHRLSAGYVRGAGNLGTFLSARLSWLQLVRDREGAYAGLEVQFLPLFGVGSRLGAFRPLRSGEGGRLLWIADFSWGL
jgi:hypothetical protein